MIPMVIHGSTANTSTTRKASLLCPVDAAKAKPLLAGCSLLSADSSWDTSSFDVTEDTHLPVCRAALD